MDRKQLIEDAAKAYANDLATSPEHVKDRPDSSHVTPTDDEDRAFAWAEYRKNYEPNPVHFYREGVAFRAGWEARAGFHRTVQGEPDLMDRLKASLQPAPKPQGEPSDAQVGPVFNVQIFGAVGDGDHDDTAAIQATIDAAAELDAMKKELNSLRRQNETLSVQARESRDLYSRLRTQIERSGDGSHLLEELQDKLKKIESRYGRLKSMYDQLLSKIFDSRTLIAEALEITGRPEDPIQTYDRP